MHHPSFPLLSPLLSSNLSYLPLSLPSAFFSHHFLLFLHLHLISLSLILILRPLFIFFPHFSLLLLFRIASLLSSSLPSFLSASCLHYIPFPLSQFLLSLPPALPLASSIVSLPSSSPLPPPFLLLWSISLPAPWPWLWQKIGVLLWDSSSSQWAMITSVYPGIAVVTANFFPTPLRLGCERVCEPYLAAATQRITLPVEM